MFKDFQNVFKKFRLSVCNFFCGFTEFAQWQIVSPGMYSLNLDCIPLLMAGMFEHIWFVKGPKCVQYPKDVLRWLWLTSYLDVSTQVRVDIG